MADDAAVAAAGARLAGAAVRSLDRVAGGGNNQIYRLRAGDTTFAFKWYPAFAGDARDRLGAEFGALRFLHGAGITDVPRAVARDDTLRCALYTWVAGQPVTPDRAAIAELVGFFGRLHAARVNAAAATLPWASEAVPTWTDLCVQVEQRLERLDARGPQEPELAAFLASEARPLWARLAGAGGPDAPAGSLTLSPSDAGTHNMLRTPGGRAVFLDFEYFGWDDPVKLVCDVLWHPAMGLEGHLVDQLLVGVADIYRDDASYPERLHGRLAAFGLRWALIVLNEFQPAHWERRRLAGVPGDWGAVKERQLELARSLVSRARAVREGAPWPPPWPG